MATLWRFPSPHPWFENLPWVTQSSNYLEGGDGWRGSGLATWELCDLWKIKMCSDVANILSQLPNASSTPFLFSPCFSLETQQVISLVTVWSWNATIWCLHMFPFPEFPSLRSCALCNVCAAQITIRVSFYWRSSSAGALLDALRNHLNWLEWLQGIIYWKSGQCQSYMESSKIFIL